MPSPLLFPLDQIRPSEVLSQYSEWIYFTLILVFFISVAGVALRKHFDRPYVKPLIISVGLMLTFGVFRYRNRVAQVFEGWGILGTILLVIMAATVPYGLCRGFGLSAGRSFYLTYILFYVLSWVKFPGFYYLLGENNLGLVNLGLLVLFIVAIFKVVRFSRGSRGLRGDFSGDTALDREIARDMKIENREGKAVRREAEKMTRLEMRSVEDIAEALAKMQQIIETHRNNLPREERERITHILRTISRDKDIFKKGLRNLQKLFQGVDVMDIKELRELKERMTKAEGKEKKILRAELEGEEEKIRIEKAILELEQNLGRYLDEFNRLLMAGESHIGGSPYPYDAEPYIAKARVVLKDIMQMLKESKALEDKLISLTKTEKRLLKQEKKTT